MVASDQLAAARANATHIVLLLVISRQPSRPESA